MRIRSLSMIRQMRPTNGNLLLTEIAFVRANICFQLLVDNRNELKIKPIER